VIAYRTSTELLEKKKASQGARLEGALWGGGKGKIGRVEGRIFTRAEMAFGGNCKAAKKRVESGGGSVKVRRPGRRPRLGVLQKKMEERITGKSGLA